MKKPKDPRSTQRKRARKALYKSGVPYICGSPEENSDDGCGRSPKELPKSAAGYDLELAEDLNDRYKSVELEANHINKNIMDNDLVNLEWLCRSCHKRKDLRTEKGISLEEDEFGYSDPMYESLFDKGSDPFP